MYEKGEDVYYYLTLYNENYAMPPMPQGAADGILRGLYLFRPARERRKLRATLLGSGSILRQALRAQELLESYDIAADVWSATSYQQLRNDALEVERWNRLHPDAAPREPFLAKALRGRGPIVAASDYVKAWPDQIGRWAPQPFVPLGTDGFGRSDTRDALRRHFEVDAEHITVATLWSLSTMEQVAPSVVRSAIGEFGIDPEKIDPRVA
jgi:pyruvate dehydrogenase E1 component